MNAAFNYIKITLIAVLFFACNSDTEKKDLPDNFDYGKVSGNIYTNAYFKFSINLPENWVVQSQEQVEEMADLGNDMIAGNDKNMKAVLKVSKVKVANLLAVFEYEVGAAVEHNPSLLIVAENIKSAPGMKTGADYLYHSRKLIRQSQVQYDYLSEEFEQVVINGTEFYRMDMQMNMMGMEIKQEFYSTVLKKFSFSVAITYITEEQKETLLESIHSMKFK